MGFDDKLVRKKLEVLLKDDTLVEKYLRVFGPKLDMGNITKLKQEQMRTASPEGTMGDKNDPTFQIMVKCPICNQEDIVCHELKAKSLTSALDKFQVPRYTGVKPFRTINYSLFAVTVCPSCLFASPDKRDFTTFTVQTRSENKSQLSPMVLEELRKRVEERKKLIPAADYAAFFSQPRTIEAGIASYRLAIQRVLAETSLETPFAWYKAGMYGLRSPCCNGIPARMTPIRSRMRPSTWRIASAPASLSSPTRSANWCISWRRFSCGWAIRPNAKATWAYWRNGKARSGRERARIPR